MEPPTPTENNHLRRQSQSQSQQQQQQQQPLRLQTSFQQQEQNPPFHPSFPQKLHEMSLPLAPFVQVTSGQIHPFFPQTLLHFWLLTDEQLDALASFYHQSTPCEWKSRYPCPITWHGGLSLEEKRRKIGKFIGLRGCDTPIPGTIDDNGRPVWGRAKTEEEIMEDARRARLANEEDEIRRKMGWN